MSQRTQRSARKARKLDRAKTLALAEQGMSTADIAQHQDVNPSTVWRFLELAKPERQALEQFKSNRADVFARLAGKSLDLQEKIMDSVDDVMIRALTPHQKTGLLHTLNAQAGTLHDKERLERGLSTENHSLLTKILNVAVEEAYKPKRVGQAVAKPPTSRNGDCPADMTSSEGQN